VPASRRNLPGSDHPPSGYKTLVGVYGAVACSTQPATLVETPTDCAAPADGFEKTTALATAFCCVKTLTAYDPARVVFSQLSCSGSYYGKPSSITAGGVALCTEDGIFAGWEC
jgi:hypothetical protein